MNLASVIGRKGKQERLLDELTETIKRSIEKDFRPLDNTLYNDQLTANIQTIERILMDVTLE